MRKPVVAGCMMAAGVAALGVGSEVLASPQFSAAFQTTYSAQTPRSSSGLDALGTWSDPGEPGGKPKEVTRIKLDFHPGTRFDTSALSACRASDAKVRRLSSGACPRSTVLGSVQTESVISTGARFDAKVFLFNARRQIIVLVTIAGRVVTVFRDDVKGRSITINLAIPKGVSLTRLHAQIPRHTRKRGKKRRFYMRTPPVCPSSGVWTTTATFTYRDGSTQQLTAGTSCKQARA
jgi:hypothetical protein